MIKTGLVLNGIDVYAETLKNGLVRYFQSHLECGGTDFRKLLLSRIRQYGRHSYNRGYEWCSGAGPLGYTLLDEKIVDHISFSDCFQQAIDACLLTARQNKIEDKVSAFASRTISDIPVLEKWDLVVSNPPHVWDLESSRKSLEEQRFTPEAMSNMLRILVDENMNTHKEFFANIAPRLNPDADLFIIEHDVGAKDTYIEMANAGGLKFVDHYFFGVIENTHPHILMHFKPK